MAITTFALSVSNETGAITNVIINDPVSGQHILLPGQEELVLASRQARLQIVSMTSPLPELSGLDHLAVRVVTTDPQGHQLSDTTFVAGTDPYIDLAPVQNALRRVTFSIYRPVVTTTHYQLYCGDDVSSYIAQAGTDRYVVRPANSPVVFDYNGDVYVLSVYGPSDELCTENKVDITTGSGTWLLADSNIIPRNPNGTRSAYVRYFGIPYTAHFRSMTPGLTYVVYADGEYRGIVLGPPAETDIVIHANEVITLRGFSHPAGYGRPWAVYADSDGSYQDITADLTGGTYRLWFSSRTRRVQVKASKKEDALFHWWSVVYDPVKIKPKKFFSVNMTAACWNRFCQKIYDTYRLWSRYPSGSLPTVSSGDELTADIFNRAGVLIAGLHGAGSCPEATSGEVVKADYFHVIKAALNSAIEYYMDSDE